MFLSRGLLSRYSRRYFLPDVMVQAIISLLFSRDGAFVHIAVPLTAWFFARLGAQHKNAKTNSRYERPIFACEGGHLPLEAQGFNPMNIGP